MNKFTLWFFATLLLWALSLTCKAQASGYKVDILVEKAAFYFYGNGEYGPRIRIYKDVWNDDSKEYALWYEDNCIKLPKTFMATHDIGKVYSTTTSSNMFKLIVVTHDEHQTGHNGNQDCIQDGSDALQASGEKDIDLNAFAPGVYSPAFLVQTSTGLSSVHVYIKIRYTPLQLLPPAGNHGLNCSDADFTLQTGLPSNVTFTNVTGLTYAWEYNIGGRTKANPSYPDCWNRCQEAFQQCVDHGGNTNGQCYGQRMACEKSCGDSYPPLEDWQTLHGTQTDNKITFNPLTDIFNGSLFSTTPVYFKVKAVGPELTGPFSASAAFSFVPPPPKATSITLDESSCAIVPTGKVTVSGVTGLFGNCSYVFKKGTDPVECNPFSANPVCILPVDRSGRVSGNIIQRNDLESGVYTLYLMNEGGTKGFCPRTIGSITVPVVPNLVVNSLAPLDPLCHAVAEGAVSLSISGGKPSSVTYDLLNQTDNTTTNKSSSTADAETSFTQLAPGNYTLTTQDGCTPTITNSFTLKQPVAISETEFQSAAAACNTPGDGVASVKVARSSGAFDKSASSVLHYQLFKDGLLFDEQKINDNHFAWTNLPPSSAYSLTVRELGASDCNALIKTFVVQGPAPLGFKDLAITDVRCFGATDGQVNVEGIGGMGHYTYQLLSSTGSPRSNTSGSFSGLAPGNYDLTVMNSATSCADKFTQPIVVATPSALAIRITPQDISCHGLTDGQVFSSVSGGTPGPGYRYTWEAGIGGGWSTLSNTQSLLTNTSSGTYRLRIKDDHQCDGISNEVTVTEPSRVEVFDVQVNDISCYGGSGFIAASARGGTGPYAFEYAGGSGGYFTANASTPLSAGNYAIRARDSHGCPADEPGPYEITSPTTPLTFQETLSDFNGYNISCFGGSNGAATLDAHGGNGGSYSGYRYALDGNTFATAETLTGINAGPHTLSVMDGRHCLISKRIVFTQTTAQLSVNIVQQQDVTCYGDETGSVSVVGIGGLPPYTYSLNSASFQNSGAFANLAADAYSLVVKDKNACDNTSTLTIGSRYPKMEIETTTTDVSCFGGADGKIEASITGGVAPYTYAWSGGTNAPAAQGLAAGSYGVTVTDHVGCSFQWRDFVVRQPLEPLTMTLNIIPVCYGKSNGSITANVKGGTSPYRYLIEEDQRFQTNPDFQKGAGQYHVTTQDSKGCQVTIPATVVLRNDQPEPNFLVATRRNAMDTLVITDISIPKPDSLHWQFDSRAIVVKNDAWTPELLFQEPGNYTATMTGYFGGCDYLVTKTLSVSAYDPNVEREKTPGYKPIESFVVTPNPSSGNFTVAATLNKKYDLTVTVYDMLGVVHYKRVWENIDTLNENVTLDHPVDGVYVVRCITEYDAKDVRIVVHP